MPQQQFYTDDQRRVRPITEPKRARVGAVVVVAVASIVALGGSGSVVTSSTGTAGVNPAQRTARTSEQDTNRAVARLRSQGFRTTIRATGNETDCAAHSYGEVQRYFATHPCTGLSRLLVEVRSGRGERVLVAVARVQMPDRVSAAALKKLVDTHGTGNVTELSRERGLYQLVRFTGDFYASSLQENVFVNAQAQPIARGVGGYTLTSIATNMVQ
jgi:hypothetical protein